MDQILDEEPVRGRSVGRCAPRIDAQWHQIARHGIQRQGFRQERCRSSRAWGGTRTPLGDARQTVQSRQNLLCQVEVLSDREPAAPATPFQVDSSCAFATAMARSICAGQPSRCRAPRQRVRPPGVDHVNRPPGLSTRLASANAFGRSVAWQKLSTTKSTQSWLCPERRGPGSCQRWRYVGPAGDARVRSDRPVGTSRPRGTSNVGHRLESNSRLKPLPLASSSTVRAGGKRAWTSSACPS